MKQTASLDDLVLFLAVADAGGAWPGGRCAAREKARQHSAAAWGGCWSVSWTGICLRAARGGLQSDPRGGAGAGGGM